MTTTLYESRYKDQKAITIESGQIAAQVLPGSGAKISSLIYKPQELELLIQRPNPLYKLASYDSDYVADGECSGIDDMFPSIDRCFYESYPWRGTPIPDHGEVWSLPWECKIENERLYCATCGVRFPYRLEKWVSFKGDNILHLDYRVSNLSGFDFDFLWAAHPMFILEEGAELALPAGIRKIVSVISPSGNLGRYGDEFDWPLAQTCDGNTSDLRLAKPRASGDFKKYYVKGKMPEGWCTLSFPQRHLFLTLAFPVEKVPYLSVLPNEGGWQDIYNIFIEPGTASFDRLDVARMHNEYSTVKAHSTYEWYLDYIFAEK